MGDNSIRPHFETLMRPSLFLFGLTLLLPAGCHRSTPPTESADTPNATPAPNPTVYDLPRLSADLKATAQARRQMAIEKAAALDAQGEDVIPVLLEALKD